MKEKVKKTAKRRSQWGEFVYRLKKNKGATISVFVLAIIIIIAVFAPYIAPYTYDAQDYSASFAKPTSSAVRTPVALQCAAKSRMAAR